jgi:hypothetical protein
MFQTHTFETHTFQSLGTHKYEQNWKGVQIESIIKRPTNLKSTSEGLRTLSYFDFVLGL